MALIGCVGTRAHDEILSAMEEAIKEDCVSRLESILTEAPQITPEELNHKCLLHQASWFGYPECVKLLISYGADPNVAHRKNGCTPLHLAHFCTIEDTDPAQTIDSLVTAGGSVNSPGSDRCGKCAVDHAIQHQRSDAVRALIKAGADVTLTSVLLAVDVANPQIINTLLNAGAKCGQNLEATRYWGQPLHRVIYTPLKCPRECYKSMFRLLAQATVCSPVDELALCKDNDFEPANQSSPQRCNAYRSHCKLMIEHELKVMASDYVELAQYLFAMLIRCGYIPSEAIKNAIVSGDIGLNSSSLVGSSSNVPSLWNISLSWVDVYLASPPPLRDLTIRILRSYTYRSGNILYGVSKLDVPPGLVNNLLLTNPMW